MLKMQDVYKQNPALGDPQSLSKQLEENAQKLDKLRLELKKFEVLLALYCKRISILFQNSKICHGGVIFIIQPLLDIFLANGYFSK